MTELQENQGAGVSAVVITKENVLGELKGLKVDTSPVPDGLHATVLKDTAEDIVRVLVVIFQATLESALHLQSVVTIPLFLIADLHKPHLTVNFDGVAEGGDITFNCTSPLERPGIAFYLYRHEKPTLVSVKPPDEDRHAVTFPIKNIDHSKIGNYTCQYIANISGRNLSSPHSDPVSITVIESKSIAPIAAGVGSAAGLILILALLGACLCRKGKRKENRDTRYTVSPDDQSNEPVTYAVLNLQSQPKSNRAQRQRDIAQAQSDESTLYATVKL
ncbi:uncharacterized protein LOC119960709 [Scyliorhinus canicula]|uniref:uncharacterized protein LOC119960709 n=1 Tax=Scyliorhinus canicula TaxID=7830 RepID=UPI0018F32CCB|nr:uncharacterized protein LOC119960709 [Scyliorhinus canicula]